MAPVFVVLAAAALAALQSAPDAPPPATETLRVGGTVRGTLAPGDATLAGRGLVRRYEFAAESSGPVTVSLESFDFDAFLRIESEALGAPLESDAGGIETNAKIVFTAREGSRYAVAVAANGAGKGEFTVSASSGSTPNAAGAERTRAGAAYRKTAAERALARGDTKEAARHSAHHGTRLLALGQWAEAAAVLESALALSRESADRTTEAAVLGLIGNLSRNRGDHARARSTLEESLAITRALGDRQLEVKALVNLGLLFEAMSEYERAIETLDSARVLSHELGDRATEGGANVNLGNSFRKQGQLARAREAYERGLAICREAHHRQFEATALGNLGVVCQQLGEMDRATEYHDQHLSLCREIGDRVGEARAIANLGALAHARGRYAEALEHHEAALSLARGRGDRTSEAQAIGNVGITRQALGRVAEARECFEAQLALATAIGNPTLEMQALEGLASAQREIGDCRKAIETLERLLTLARKHGETVREGKALSEIGAVSSMLGDGSRAIESLRAALELGEKSGSLGIRLSALGGLAQHAKTTGDFDSALDLNERQLALARETGTRSYEASALANLAVAAAEAGRFDEAGESAAAWLALPVELRHARQEFQVESALAKMAESLDRLAEARERYEKCLTLARGLGDKTRIAMVLVNASSVHEETGQVARAVESATEALGLARASGARWIEASSLLQLGVFATARGSFAEAESLLTECIGLVRQLGDRRNEAQAWSSLGTLFHRRGDAAKARDAFEKSLALDRERGNSRDAALTLANMGTVYYGFDDHVRARACAEEALEICERTGDERARLGALDVLARLALHEGRFDDSVRHVREAEALIERRPKGSLSVIESAWNRSRYSAWATLSVELSLVQLERHGDEPGERARILTDALASAGLWQGRALLSGIAERRTGARSPEAMRIRRERDEVLAKRERALERLARVIQSSASTASIEELRTEERMLLGEARTLAERLRAASPRDAAIDSLAPRTSPEALRATLGPRRALVQFLEGDQNMGAIVLTEERQDILHLGPKRSIESERDAFSSLVSDPSRLAAGAAGPIAAAGRALFDRLLAPALLSAGDRVDEILVIPSPAVAGVPFEALVIDAKPPAGGAPLTFADVRFVIDRYDVAYAPSAAVVADLFAHGPREKPGRSLVLGDPTYPSEARRIEKSRGEALALARLGSSPGDDAPRIAALEELSGRRSGVFSARDVELRLGADASPRALSGNLEEYSIVHLAAHGYLDRAAPEKSGIALSPDGADEASGFVTIRDVLELDLDADLVTLSACETAAGGTIAGEGVQSMAWAFLYAGSRGVVASLWPVADWATSETMSSLYSGMIRRGVPPARALRDAKLELRRSRALVPRGDTLSIGRTRSTDGADSVESAHPFFWAPFVYTGLPR